jgi:regulator of sigma E protease
MQYFVKNPDFKYKYSLINSIKYWFLETVNQTKLTFIALGDLWQKIFSPKTPIERTQAIESMSWPVGIVNIITKIINKWIWFLLIFWALISINLWVMNILPIPALDWWRFFIVAINWFFKTFFKKKLISPYFEVIIHSLFFVILMWLIMFITYNDITKLL